MIKNYDTYIVGLGYIKGWNYHYAIYWKNKAPYLLTSGNDAQSVYVNQNNDVYIAGTVAHTNGNKAAYWKNGNLVELNETIHQFSPTDAFQEMGTSITGDGNNNIYVARYANYFPGSYLYSNVTYWKISPNDSVKETPVVILGSSAYPPCIATSGNKVYVSSSRQVDNWFSTPSYWINDNNGIVKLTTGKSYGMATAVTTNGTDIYAVGFDGTGGYQSPNTAKFWKNDINGEISLTNGARDASANAVTTSGNDIYVAGSEVNNRGIRVAKYWKITGTNVTEFDITDGKYSAAANSIIAKGDDLFIVGYEVNAIGIQIAKLWRIYKNMKLSTTLPIPSYHTIIDPSIDGFVYYATGIVVK